MGSDDDLDLGDDEEVDCELICLRTLLASLRLMLVVLPTVDEGDIRDRTTDYLDELAKTEANRYARENDLFDSDSVWSDEILWASPLDQFDCYQRFSSLLSCMFTSLLRIQSQSPG